VDNHLATLEKRLQKLEAAMEGRDFSPQTLTPRLFTLGLASAMLSITLGYHGLKLPNHPYQICLALMAVAFLYHRRVLLWPGRRAEWVLPVLNILQLSFILKILIGSGKFYPFEWLKYPTLLSSANGEKWLQVVPQWKMVWEPTPLAAWDLDLTVLQTFLSLMTLVGASFSFQPFASLMATLLLLASLPAFAQFDWNYVFPALFSSAVSFYLQRPQPKD